jgi:PilZ domain
LRDRFYFAFLTMNSDNRKQSEQRKHPRRQINYAGAKIVIDKKGTALNCRLFDVSQGGARIVLENDQGTPDRFLLLLAPNGGTPRACRVIWRNGPILGVAFSGVRDPAPASTLSAYRRGMVLRRASKGRSTS